MSNKGTKKVVHERRYASGKVAVAGSQPKRLERRKKSVLGKLFGGRFLVPG